MNCGKILSNMNPNGKNLICLYSEPNFLAVNILENLLANNCLVNIVSENTNGWYKLTSHVAIKGKFNIGTPNSFQNDISYGYVIFCSGFLAKDKANKDLEKFLHQMILSNTKTFIILPKEFYGKLNINQSNISDDLGVIYLGDLLGPRIDLSSDLKMQSYLREIISSRSLTLPVGEVFYPILVSDAARQIVKWLFAFGPFGKETFLLGPEISSSVFWQLNTKLVGEIKYISDAERNTIRLPKNIDIFKLTRDTKYLLSETYRWISANPSVKVDHFISKKIIKDRIKTATPISKTYKKILLPLLVILVFPLILLIISFILTGISFYQFRYGNDNVAVNLLSAGKFVAKTGMFESTILKHIPLAGQVYKETEYLSYTLTSVSEIGTEAIPLVRKSNELLSNMLGNNPYSINTLLSGSDEKLQEIYDMTSKFEEYSTKSSNEGSLTAHLVLTKFSFEDYKKLIYQLTTIINETPTILGSEESKTYLVLFENNMELRPTGGFIGSFGLLTFDDGRLSEVTINDVYSADGQLNGHVEPPAPIRQYLGEANWWLRDSNWDPDFPTSAKRAEWFLDKEISQEVDGVVSIDLNPIKDFLKVSGPIYLSDYDLDITTDNLYEKVQSEVQDNFFPGTHKKASFLTTLSRNILLKTSELSASQKLQFIKLAYENLNERHIQMFLHKSEFQKSMSALGWDGSVFIPTCNDECSNDLVGLVEANVGVNKSNYFIKRDVGINININGKIVEKGLTLNLQNSATASLGPSGRYKSYIRLLVPENAANIKVASTHGQNRENLIPDLVNSKGYKEVGVMVEVLPGETKQITFDWTVEFDKKIKQYNLYYRKQAGVDNYPLGITLNTPVRLLNSSPTFSLTKQGNYIYNATLARDLMVRFSF